MTKYCITLDELIIIRDCAHYINANASLFVSNGFRENAGKLYSISEKLDMVVNNLLDRERESIDESRDLGKIEWI
jgi:hypothetical protein